MSSRNLEEKYLIVVKGTPKAVAATLELLTKIIEAALKIVPGVKNATIKKIDL